jgi:hypothetical protein
MSCVALFLREKSLAMQRANPHQQPLFPEEDIQGTLSL